MLVGDGALAQRWTWRRRLRSVGVGVSSAAGSRRGWPASWFEAWRIQPRSLLGRAEGEGVRPDLRGHARSCAPLCCDGAGAKGSSQPASPRLGGHCCQDGPARVVEGDQWRGGILTNNFRDVFLMFFFKCMFVCTKCVTIIIVTFSMYSAPYRKI